MCNEIIDIKNNTPTKFRSTASITSDNIKLECKNLFLYSSHGFIIGYITIFDRFFVAIKRFGVLTM